MSTYSRNPEVTETSASLESESSLGNVGHRNRSGGDELKGNGEGGWFLKVDFTVDEQNQSSWFIL